MEKKNSDRRGFFSKVAKLGIAGGVGALLLGRLGDKTLIPPVHAADMAIDANNTGTGTTKLTSSGSDTAFYAVASKTSGDTEGILGDAHSPDGEGVQGRNYATTGDAFGVAGDTWSPTGKATIGHAWSTTGEAVGVKGISNSTSGRGVEGLATTTSGVTRGVYGSSDSTGGNGVEGFASASTGTNRGIFGQSNSASGRGIEGWAAATLGTNYGVYGRSDSSGGRGVYGRCAGGYGVYGSSDSDYGVIGESDSGVGVLGDSDGPNAVPIAARGHTTQTANLQEWRNSAETPLSVINKDGWMGLGISSPARSTHLKGDQACFRMDRNVNSSAFILVRTSPDFSSVWKTFYVGVDASGVNNGEFFIGDVGTNVSGASTKRLWIENSGKVNIPNLGTGDIEFANGVRATEEGKGLAFLNDAGEKIAVLDREGNFHIRGKVLEDL